MAMATLSIWALTKALDRIVKARPSAPATAETAAVLNSQPGAEEPVAIPSAPLPAGEMPLALNSQSPSATSSMQLPIAGAADNAAVSAPANSVAGFENGPLFDYRQQAEQAANVAHQRILELTTPPEPAMPATGPSVGEPQGTDSAAYQPKPATNGVEAYRDTDRIRRALVQEMRLRRNAAIAAARQQQGN